MHSSSLLLSALAAAATAAPSFTRPLVTRQEGMPDIESFIATQRNISLSGALANIGGTNSSQSEQADPGIVVASPSTENPNYYYTWTRDSALTFLMVTDELIFGTEMDGNISLQKTIEDYTMAQAVLQTVTNPSGSLWPAGLGLGEPKFYTNKTRFDGTWGRPQNDGPAFRASAFLEIAEAIFERNPNASDIVTEVYWPMVLNDLRYVGQYWNTSSYDPWEEVNGNSFFTTIAQHRALVQGSIWADKLNTTCEPCKQASQILCFLQNNFWNETGNYLLANINANQVNRSQIGVDPILGSMHAFDINATCDAGPMQPCNSKVLATHKVVTDSFRNLYEINQNASAPAAVAIGRYPEDTYYDGNPWYLTTLAMAEVLYDAAAQFDKNDSILVDEISQPFWNDLFPNISIGYYEETPKGQLTDALRAYADGFVQVVQAYTPANGTLNEQINKTTGEGTSAIALTWSFASFVTASERRAGQFPPSWGASSDYANDAAEDCVWSSYNSTFNYTAAEGAGAKSVDMPCLSEVIFHCNASTMFGQNIYFVANNSMYGGSLDDNSSTNVYQPLRTGNITADWPLWNLPTWLPPDEPLGYRYALQNQSAMTFELSNETYAVTPGACGSGMVIVTDDAPTFPGTG